MQGWKRSTTTLAGAVLAGALIWFVPHFHRWTTGGYWAGMALFALAGLVLGVAQLRGREGNSEALFLVVFVPLLVVVGWVVLAAQPRDNWFQSHAGSWAGDIGVGRVVHNLSEHVSVLAFGLGLVFGLTFEAGMLRRLRPARGTTLPVVPVAVPVAVPAPLDEPAVAVPAPEAAAVLVADEPTVVAPPEEPTVVTPPEEPTIVSSADEPIAVAHFDEETAVIPADEPTVVSPPEQPTVVSGPEVPTDEADQPER